MVIEVYFRATPWALPVTAVALVLSLLWRRPLGLVAWMTRSAWPILAAVAVPFLAEGVQWLLPPLGRAAFLFADIVANWIGVVLGALLAAAVALAGQTSDRRVSAGTAGVG
ncbi:hypothetical protein ACFP3Q_18060 [Nocardioides sp. GCM10027113]|uniref:hypothetical protein n=1 Tax=unclassified Nocardioides TaxID=2615069 RepID=UPI003617F8DC